AALNLSQSLKTLVSNMPCKVTQGQDALPPRAVPEAVMRLLRARGERAGPSSGKKKKGETPMKGSAKKVKK
ncbi:hypothetical protein GUITHDRAFT_122664, partial [Guillardia theta CCMP2712]